MKDINPNELYTLIANQIGYGATSKSVQRYLVGIYKIILQQLELNGRVYFKGFGYWELREHKGGAREINDPINGGKRIVYVSEKYSIFFKPSVNFEESVNSGKFKICSEKKARQTRNRKKKTRKKNVADLFNIANKRLEKSNERKLNK